MKLPFGLKIEKRKAAETGTVNLDQYNKLYEQLTRFFSKGQFIWNKNDLQNIIENGYLFNPDVYAIINKIIQTASMVGWQTYEVKNSKALSKYKSYKFAKNYDAMQEMQHKALEPVEEHPLMDLLENPNPYTTGTILDQNLLGFYCLLGNSYLNKIVIAGTKGDIPGELQVLPAYLVKIVFGSNKKIIDGYSIQGWNELNYKFTTEEIYHFKSFNPDFGVGQFMYGANPSVAPALAKSNESYQAAISLIANLGAMGILSSGNDETIEPGDAEKIKDRYYAEYGGAKNRGKVLIIGHKMDYTNMAQSIADLNLIQGQEQDFLTLCRVYNVDSRIMGYVKGSTFSNMREARQDFLQNRILPLKYMQAEAYNNFLLKSWNSLQPKQYYIDVDYKSIPEMANDTSAISIRLQGEIKRGMITPAEAAKIMGYPDLTDATATQLWIGTDMQPMKNADTKPTAVTVH